MPLIDFRPHRFGRYWLLDLLGKGGMAEVFLATAVSPGSENTIEELFAIKRLLPKYSSNRIVVQKLIDEAKVASLLHHPNIVEVRDLGVLGTDFFIEMEWINGKTLDQTLSCLRMNQRYFPRQALLSVFHQISAALHFSHRATDSVQRPLDLVHCDVNPQNVLLGYDGVGKLSDFGIATAARFDDQPSSPKEVAVGKLAYMAPEQIQKSLINQKSDIFGLGVMLYEAVTLEKPFQGGSALELLQSILEISPNLDLEPLSDDKELRNIVGCCLMKNPTLRPSSVMEQFESIERYDAQRAQQELQTFMEELFGVACKEEAKRREQALQMVRENLKPLDLISNSSSLADEEPTDEISTQLHEQTQWAEDNLSPSPIKAISGSEASVELPKEKILGQIELMKKQVVSDVQDPIVKETLDPALKDDSIIELGTPYPIVKKPAAETFSGPGPTYTPYRPTTSVTFSSLPSPKTVLIIASLILVPFLFFIFLHFRQPSRIGSEKHIRDLMILATIEGEKKHADPTAIFEWSDPVRRERNWVQPLREFFVREFSRYAGDRPLQLEITMAVCKDMAPTIEWSGLFFQPMIAFETLAKFCGVSEEVKSPAQARVFVHLYPKLLTDRPRYPLDYSGRRPFNQGLVFVPLSRLENSESLARLAHEIIHTLGGSDKYGKHGVIEFPRGYVDPYRKPLFPQPYGEIMARGIPLSRNEYKPFQSLREARIGHQTAMELGWISENTADRFYAN